MLSIFLLTTYPLFYFITPGPPDWNACVCAQSLSPIWFSAAPWTVALQAPLSMRFSRQEYWSGLPFPSPGNLPDPGIEPTSLASLACAGRLFTAESPGKLPIGNITSQTQSTFTYYPFLSWRWKRRQRPAYAGLHEQHVEQTLPVARPDSWAFTISGQNPPALLTLSQGFPGWPEPALTREVWPDGSARELGQCIPLPNLLSTIFHQRQTGVRE